MPITKELSPFRLTSGLDQFTTLYFAGRKTVLVTPDPGFSGLNGTDQWMAGVMEVSGGMLIFRIIAAAYVPTFKAEAEMYPGITSLDALLADVNAGVGDLDLI
jgi:hypothetical protein